jgi:hypothetical protein
MGLRHSFISYRLAAIQNTAQVALEAGNSPQMIFRHYRACLAAVRRRQELVTEKAAKAWFAITPDAARALKAKIEKERTTKILAFPATAAA